MSRSRKNTRLQTTTRADTRQSANLVFQSRQLRIEDVEFVKALGRIEGANLIIERSVKQARLKTPVTVPISKILALGHRGLAQYIVQGLTTSQPSLIPLILDNNSMIELARHFLRKYSASILSLYTYSNSIAMYARSWGSSPDEIIADARKSRKRVDEHQRALQENIDNLRDNDRAPGRLHNFDKQIRTWYRCNGVDLERSDIQRPKVTYKDRSPSQQELAVLLDAADLREKCIISLLALGGFREETLSLLRYRHVKDELYRRESPLEPVHVHIEKDITKGEYESYDSFIRAEAVQYLRQYLEARKAGRLDPRIKPETVTDDSPLIRDMLWDRTRGSETPLAVGPKQIYKIVHDLFVKTGLVQLGEKHYKLRVHTFRKFFKTNLVAAGVPESHADYFLGHVTDVYNQVHDLGVEKLRESYAKGQLCIRPQSQANLTRTLVELIRAAGKDPGQYLKGEALSEPHRVMVGPEGSDQREARILLSQLTEIIRQRLATTENSTTS